ncbi:MAG TPA: NifB/NifX family molybdenum-iron cluster-binding protein [Spirochaetota bacterium]|nr:NifB/NifX family molybdenum-iron cluster-binding protein [Spirochaetota bacterium]HPI89343.1 NifB/NifX family molybdenum-iron cluster-binding protein [Spirochaetota bacterium]HPR48311.1 NifB/NifX family molybdenum-iron cluster-binding protein [Spirochaetota bacterium]
MITAISVENKSSDGIVDARFGRAAFFALYNHEKDEWSFVDNSADLSLSQGAGIQAAKKVINAGADSLITCNVGPKAYDLLIRSGVKIFSCEPGTTVPEALKAKAENRLQRLDSANRDSHW